VKTKLLTLALVALLSAANAENFTRATKYPSVDAFIAAVKAFAPSKQKTDLARLFAARPNHPEDPEYGKLVFAEKIESCTTIWSDDSDAVVFANAKTNKDYPDAVGVLFLLKHAKDTWRIVETKKFTAVGKYAGVEAVLDSGYGAGWKERIDGIVVTVTESLGGRGYSYSLSASYRVDDAKFKRQDLP
jgi:hypothetical protein